MNKKEKHRIKFFSIKDLSIGHQLLKIEELLEENLEFDTNSDINDLFELYNVKLYFDYQLFLPNWTGPQKSKYISIVEQSFNKLKEHIYTIKDSSFEQELRRLDYYYYDDFWKLFSNLNAYNNISEKTFEKTLRNNQQQVYHILRCKKIVEKYDTTIRNFLMDYENSAEIILSSLEEKDNFNNKEPIFFPKSLSLSDKESIINSYLDTEEPNLNYVRLIENSRDTSKFRLSPKTRLKAKKKSKELNEIILQNGNVLNIGIGISFKKDQIEPVIFNYEGTFLKVSYSESFIDRFVDNIDLFLIFKYLFRFIDDKNLIALVSKQNELDALERVLVKSKNEYEIGVVFQRKEYLAHLQLIVFEQYLNRKGKNIETLINSYVNYINQFTSPHKLIFQIPTNNRSYLEKIRIITPDLEFLLKQYKTLIEENKIDYELIQIDSSPIRFSHILSHKTKKYLYSNDNIILQLKYLFFSDQSHLFYVKPFENKYQNLFDLLTKENVKLEYFKNYQKQTIESLINDEYLKLDEQGYVKLNKLFLIYLIGELHNKEALSYWNYSVEFRNVLDKMIDDKLLIAENTLFTRQEMNYLNFYLNKKQFTNGYDLRNKYLHGTNTFSEKEHEIDYFRLIKLIILVLLKIEDDIKNE